ncbi:MAG: TRAP transporter substrate-binding protein [Paracoccus sp. (in: a-proteobacteria)]|nr:TRAP transporter substrate-binding protein [Paracoccus sp. (in: a-proteobacteria)]
MRYALLAAALSLTALPASAQEVTLRLHHFLGATTPTHTEFLAPWAERVEQESGGRIAIEIYPSMTLGGRPPQLFDQARDGVVDISWTLLGYTPGRFPIAELFELPFMGSDATTTSIALQRFAEAHLGEELAAVHVIGLHAPSAYKLHSAGPVASMQDLTGLKIRAPSRAMTDMLAELGATAVGMPVPEVAQALTSGVIDGAILPWEMAGAMRIEELTPYHLEIGQENGGLASSVMALVMNRDAYARLPDDLRAALDAHSGEALARFAGETWDRTEAETRAAQIAAGAIVTVLPEDEAARWRERAGVVSEDWVRAMDRAGLDGQAMLDDARRLIGEARDDR